MTGNCQQDSRSKIYHFWNALRAPKTTITFWCASSECEVYLTDGWGGGEMNTKGKQECRDSQIVTAHAIQRQCHGLTSAIDLCWMSHPSPSSFPALFFTFHHPIKAKKYLKNNFLKKMQGQKKKSSIQLSAGINRHHLEQGYPVLTLHPWSLPNTFDSLMSPSRMCEVWKELWTIIFHWHRNNSGSKATIIWSCFKPTTCPHTRQPSSH